MLVSDPGLASETLHQNSATVQSAMRRQIAVAAYFSKKQLLLFVLAGQLCYLLNVWQCK